MLTGTGTGEFRDSLPLNFNHPTTTLSSVPAPLPHSLSSLHHECAVDAAQGDDDGAREMWPPVRIRQDLRGLSSSLVRRFLFLNTIFSDVRV